MSAVMPGAAYPLGVEPARPVDVLIFDDDAYLASMFAAVFEDMGLTTERLYNGYGGLEDVRRCRPRLVVTDIMMPGLDGLSLCRLVKSDPETAGTKVVVVSGKPYAADRAEAERCGADLYLAKPFDPVHFQRSASKLLGPAEPSSGGGPARPKFFSLRVWGAGGERGFCLSADLGDVLLVLDAGRGAGELAAALGTLAKETWVLLSCQDPDHLAGLPALCALRSSGGTLNLTAPQHPREFLSEAVGGVLRLSRTVPRLFTLPESRFPLGRDTTVAAMLTRHPGASMAFRVQHKRRAFVYAPLNELETDEDIQTDFGEKFGRLVRGADVLIHDARYADADYPARRGRGHSCPRQAIELSLREGVQRLALFGVDPGYGEDRMAAALELFRREGRSAGNPFRVDLARPGWSIEV